MFSIRVVHRDRPILDLSARNLSYLVGFPKGFVVRIGHDENAVRMVWCHIHLRELHHLVVVNSIEMRPIDSTVVVLGLN